MRPAPRLYSAGLTGLRAYAALWVMLFHLNAIVGPKRLYVPVFGQPIDVTPLVTVGWVGVDLFFVLSGFLLTTHLLERWHAVEEGTLMRGYFLARVRRVFPAYWAQLAILLAVAVVAGGGKAPAWLADLPLHLLMIHNVTERTSSAINGVYWTLPIEFSFYLCLPLVARYLARGELMPERESWLRLAALVAPVLAMTWAYRYAVFHAYSASPVSTIVWAVSQLPGTMDQFMMGTGAAAGYRLLKRDHAALVERSGRWSSTALLAVGTCGLVFMMFYIHWIYEAYWSGHWALFAWHTLASFFIACIVLAIAISGTATRLVFENRVVLFLGTISYSIYLWHFPVALWTAGFLDMSGMGLRRFALLATPLVILVSACSYYGAERPFLRRS